MAQWVERMYRCTEPVSSSIVQQKSCTTTISRKFTEYKAQGYFALPHLQNNQRASPEGSVCVDIRSINQSSTSQDAQMVCSDPSHTQSVHGTTDCVWLLQESPYIATKSVVNMLENREDYYDLASVKKSPPVSTPKQNIPAELTHQGRPVEPMLVLHLRFFPYLYKNFY